MSDYPYVGFPQPLRNPSAPGPDYGARRDGTQKGVGWLGELRRLDNPRDVSTELTVDVTIDGKQMGIPLLVPTLSPDEVGHLLSTSGNTPLPQQILKKAVDHARERLARGLSPYAN